MYELRQTSCGMNPITAHCYSTAALVVDTVKDKGEEEEEECWKG